MIKLPEKVWLGDIYGYTEAQLKQAVRDALEKPAPDCRTCKFIFVDQFGHDDCNRGCINGDKYQPAPAVVLWRTK